MLFAKIQSINKDKDKGLCLKFEAEGAQISGTKPLPAKILFQTLS